MKPPSTLLPPPVTAPLAELKPIDAVAGAGEAAGDARRADADVAARLRVDDDAVLANDRPSPISSRCS